MWVDKVIKTTAFTVSFHGFLKTSKQCFQENRMTVTTLLSGESNPQWGRLFRQDARPTQSLHIWLRAVCCRGDADGLPVVSRRHHPQSPWQSLGRPVDGRMWNCNTAVSGRVSQEKKASIIIFVYSYFSFLFIITVVFIKSRKGSMLACREAKMQSCFESEHILSCPRVRGLGQGEVPLLLLLWALVQGVKEEE